MKKSLMVGSMMVLWAVATWSQSPDIREILGYPQTIVHNAKVITVSDESFNSNLGTIAQALAIRDGKILATGTNADMLALAGPQTERIDLRGRTVVPGFVMVHNHPQDWMHVVPNIVNKVVPEDVMIGVYLRGTPQQQMEEFPRRLEEAVRRAEPGVWIYSVFIWDPPPAQDDPYLRWAGTRITKEMLDMIAPENPVIVRGRSVLGHGGLDNMVNQRAVEAIRQDGRPDTVANLNNLEQEEQTGVGSGLEVYRMTIPEVIFKDNFEAYAEMLRLDLSWWTALGQTTTGQFLYHYPNVIKAFRTLDQRGQMPHRHAWAWGASPTTAWERGFEDPFLVADLATRLGEGTDYLWYMGTGQNGDCLTIDPLPGVNRRTLDRCNYTRDGVIWNSLYKIVKDGGRIIGGHQFGDGNIDLILDLIEEASREAGMTPEEIRSKRHTADHMYLWPRPDQIPRIKELGMVTGGTERFIVLNTEQDVRDYGEKVAEWIVPRGSMLRNEIMSGIEIDKPYELVEANAFNDLHWAISRRASNGQVYAPNQRIARQEALKTATIWGAHYVLREDLLGSLEPGKFADLLVLDRDYLTIPEDEIPNIRILMTMVGGKVEHLVPSLAGELGMQATGAAVELGGVEASY